MVRSLKRIVGVATVAKLYHKFFLKDRAEITIKKISVFATRLHLQIFPVHLTRKLL